MINNAEIQISKDRISAINSFENGLAIQLGEELVNLPKGAVAYPGFVDSHGHVTGFGMRKKEVDLSKAKSFEECVELVSQSSVTRGDWLVAYGWNHENWEDKTLPSKELIDSKIVDYPVFMLRVDGHSAVINSSALKLANIDRQLLDPKGGQIVRDYSGNPTGLLIDNAINLVESIIPQYTFEQIADFTQFALGELPKYGITEVHDMDVDTEYVPIYQDLEFRDLLPIRILAYVRAQNNEWIRDNVMAYNGRMYSVKGLKYYADGALGSRGAALMRPYEDDSRTDGLLLLDEKSFYNRAKRGILSGFDIAVHSIGDRSTKFLLDQIELLRKDPLLKGRGRFRIEHSQIVNPDDVRRFAALGVVASVQPIHFSSDATGMAQKRLGARMNFSYSWKSFVESGAKLVAGSDFPIESPSPIEGIRSFLHRRPFDSNERINPEQKLTLDEAIQAYTSSPREVTDAFTQRGSLTAGKQADITILSAPLETLEKDYDAKIEVLATIVAGKMIYKNF